MGTITLYRFSLYDVRSEEMVLSKRWGTRDAIARIGGEVVETSAVEADEGAVVSDVAGLTAVGFAPPTNIIHAVMVETIGADGVVS